jgi:hypothetical protein
MTVSLDGGYQACPLTLMLRFRRGPNEPAHVETFWRYGKRTNVALCSKPMTTERPLAAYPLGSEKAAEFWSVVCPACKTAMDRLT